MRSQGGEGRGGVAIMMGLILVQKESSLALSLLCVDTVRRWPPAKQETDHADILISDFFRNSTIVRK